MNLSPLVLTILAALIFLGLLQRTLDRMRLSDRAALVIIGLMFVGTYLPDIAIGLLRINIGGALVPLAMIIYLVGTADTRIEQIRAVLAIIATTVAILVVDRVLPQEPGVMFLDPMYAYGIVAGIIGYLAGRSRRSAFVGATAGVLLADSLVAFWRIPLGMVQYIGGAGIFDSTLIAGVLAVGTAELIGESRELVAPDERRKGKE